MKKSFLLLMAGLMTASVQGQEAKSMLLSTGPEVLGGKEFHANYKPRPKQDGAAHKTTAATNRWYNYGGDYKYWLWNGSSSSISTISSTLPYSWFDTSSQAIYTGPTLDHVNLLSWGNIFQPWASAFNDSNYAGIGEVAVTPANAYTIDSIEVTGFYIRGYAQPTSGANSTDTLRISLVESDGMSGDIVQGSWTGPIGPVGTGGTLYRKDMVHDSFYNLAKNSMHFDIILNASSVNDTDGSVYKGGSGSYGNLYHKMVPVPGGFNVPAGHFTGMSVTFKSGDANSPHMPPTHPKFGDTTFIGDPAPRVAKYGMFRPYVVYHKILGSGSPGTADWAEYIPGDWNAGAFRTQTNTPAGVSWAGKYTTMWAYNGGSSTVPGTYQFPAIGYHLTCVGCPTTGSAFLGVNDVTDLNTVVAAPNPANNVLNVSFTQATGTTATVTLTNMLGQVVANQVVSNGKAVINTADLSAGLYIYSVQSEGSRVTGRVVVAH